ncbi:MAG TPA: hypothetical protein VGW40_15455 [Allosphingosinicella sp.]|nr:hypothetical protein [Allosphingosinicella sp.]
MARYRLYHLENNRLIGRDEIEAADDAEAVRLAKERAEAGVIEVWSGNRRVRTVAARAASRARIP